MTAVYVIIPALNEEQAIFSVIRALPDLVKQVFVVDNGSTDRTVDRAREAGAIVVKEFRRGYGRACQTGIERLPHDAEIVVFVDGDFSDDPSELPSLIAPILHGEADLVIGSRVLGRREKGALLPQARFGNWLATALIRLLFAQTFTDLGPFRAVRRDALAQLGMADETFGWTVEMQVRAVMKGLRVTEVPVSYRRRVGTSKITGTVKGTVMAGTKILSTIFGLWLRIIR